MKKIMFIVVAGVVAGLAILGWAWRQWTGPGPAGPTANATVQVRIPRGMTLAAAADTLRSLGLIRNANTLVLGARLAGRERGLRAGLFEMTYGRSPRQLLADLTSGRTVQVSVTIPEGFVSRDIAETVAAVFPFSAARFLAVADSLARRAVLDKQLESAPAIVATMDSLMGPGIQPALEHTYHWSEGLLAPDTYHFAEGTDPESVAGVLLETQLSRLAMAVAADRDSELSAFGLLTLASLVETEARRDDERTRIAAVYANRLRRGWRLEADPTVAFVLGKQGQRLYFKDLKVEAPHNTYRNKGLPPGPIAAPGLASLLAAAMPDPDCDAFYFVSDGDDGHVFSRTGREHEEAVRKFKAAREQQRRQGAR